VRASRSWLLFIALLILAAAFILGTASELPLNVASHFDASGRPNGFMTRSGYTRFMLCFALGVPALMAVVLTTVYSRASELRLPNRDYWMAPQHIDRTRALLMAHGVWFASLLVILACLMHRLMLMAHRAQPPHLPGGQFAAVMFAFVLATAAWIGALLFVFRRPASQ
jgi:uncharacterized membrane protein